jgi:hypothetical protein
MSRLSSIQPGETAELSAMTNTDVTPDDYFHTGAGARYLRRADEDLVVVPLRGNITVLMGSGGNIVVLSGKEGKFLVDAGIAKSQGKLRWTRPVRGH